ncbi:methionyl-tRNA formyltransferase [Burkholderiales bacterium]|nr:MAG: methionyl-tRNA formyltransferase [Burkholderiales bacterium]CAG0968980.1 methionyl-tRNA formyltransferase [Burkholderiales bacterium]
MRVAFAGTPEFAARALDAILAAGFDVPLVLTQPDRPAGRGLKLCASPVKQRALVAGIPVVQPATLKRAEWRAPILVQHVDLLVVAAYGLLLPPEILSWPAQGCLNIHASLLPRWRGAAPIQRAILAGDRETGVAIMQMDAGLDTGPVLATAAMAILPADTSGSLHDKLAAQGARLITEVLAGYAAGRPLPAVPQPSEGAVYAAKLCADDARIDWSADAEFISRQIRALDPAPGAVATLGGAPCKIWRVAVEAREGTPGAILEVARDSLLVACGRRSLRILEWQPAGSRRMSLGAYLAGHPMRAGQPMA